MSLSPEQFLVGEARRRAETDYRFSYWSYLGWTILTLGVYSHYATYRLVRRRHDHVARRLAFHSYLWHMLNARAEEAGRRDELSEGLDNLSQAYQQMEAYERANRREAILWTLLRVVFGPVGAYVNHFLNKDLRFYEEWESSATTNAAWVMQRLGFPVELPRRSEAVRKRSTGLYVLLTVITFGLFSLAWRYFTMLDGNAHFDEDDAAEDALLRGLGLASGLEGPIPRPA